MQSLPFLLTALFACAAFGQNILLTNDDGWAVAQIHAQNDALKAAGFNVSSPSPNSGGALIAIFGRLFFPRPRRMSLVQDPARRRRRH